MSIARTVKPTGTIQKPRIGRKPMHCRLLDRKLAFYK